MSEYGSILPDIRDSLHGMFVTPEKLLPVAILVIVVVIILFALFKTPKS